MGVTLMLLVSGCSTVQEYKVSLPDHVIPNRELCQNLSRHFIAIDKRGGFTPIYFDECSGITVSTAVSVTEILDEIAIQKQKRPKLKLLVFIHGGLNNPEGDKGSIRSFVADLQKMKETCIPDANKNCANYYPLFVIWPSELFDTYGDSIANYYQGEWDGKIPTISMPFRLGVDFAEILVRAPQSFFHQMKLWIDSRSLADHQTSKFLSQGNTHDICNKISGFYCVNDGDSSNFEINQFLDNYGEILFPLKLLTIPSVDPIGRRAWQSMVARSHFGFQTPCGMKIGFMPSYNSCQYGALKKFFDEFKKKGLEEMSIRLIGHSMGTILASEIIRENPDLDYEEIIFMAAAATIRQYKNDVEPVLKRSYNKHYSWKLLHQEWEKQNNNIEKIKESVSKIQQSFESLNIKKQSENIKIASNRVSATQPIVENAIKENIDIEPSEPKLIKFYNLSLHPFAEASEINVIAAAPDGSLLEWIDYNFTDPSDISDRTFGKWANLVSMPNYFDQELFDEKQVFFKRFGLSCASPIKHGGFIQPLTEYCGPRYWQPDFWENGTSL